MIWNLIFMLAGALLFGAGIAFEKGLFMQENIEDEEENVSDEVSPLVLKQWENLLGYDGNEQEVFDENN